MSAKRSASPRRRSTWAGRLLLACLRIPLRYPLRSTVSATVVGLSAVIVVNAVELQTARHPSPLFGSFPAATPAQTTAAPIGVPQPAKAEPRPPAGPKRDINALLGVGRDAASVPLPRPKRPPSSAGQAAGTGVTVR